MRDQESGEQRVRPIPPNEPSEPRARSSVIGAAVAGVAVIAAVVFVFVSGGGASSGSGVVTTTLFAPASSMQDGRQPSAGADPVSTVGPASSDETGPVTVDSVEGTSGLVFGRPLPWTLVFDDGNFGAKVVDLNHGEPVARVIEGARGGDQPYRLTAHDGHLVVGVGGIYGYDVGSGESSYLAEATIHVPAAAPSRVWMINYPGGHIGQGPREVWQVHVAGGQSTARQALGVDGSPAHGIPGGLALESDSGVMVWDSTTEAVVGTLGTRAGFVSDASAGGKLAWCEDPCDVMRITTLADSSEIAVRHPNAGAGFGARGARFSDDGRYLAAPAEQDVVVVDAATGESWIAMTFPRDVEPPVYVAWAPDSHILFTASYSYGQSETAIGYYSVVSDTAEVSTLPHGGTLSFVVIPTHEADQLLGIEPPVEPASTSEPGCPLTLPESLFTPPGPYPPDPVHEGLIWYGSDELWTVLDINGTSGQRKSVWWSASFPGGGIEAEPEIGVTWEKLDDPHHEPITDEPPGTNAFTEDDGDFMIAGIDPNTEGCWRVTATYKGATLSYVYEVP